MIFSLNGKVTSKTLTYVVVECSGVGYQVFVTPNTQSQCVQGEQVFLYTVFVVREDSQTLYGFLDEDTKEVFVRLNSVKGIGPKVALAILATYTSQELAGAVSNNDVIALSKVPGIGRRGAERMVVELKDKLTEFSSGADSASDQSGIQHPAEGKNSASVIEGLMGLGFTEGDAQSAVNSVLASPEYSDHEPDSSTLLRMALQILNWPR